ncbi:MAG: sugar phosphate isomerase/epimerase [Lachnospiraceae bacterium]|nr:sugar phosphate isomerase/epimerase [Lachnospiraceae bacterium]
MRIGINTSFPHRSPEEWADTLVKMNCRAVSFPVDYTAPVSQIDAYVKAARERDIKIAEVGIWKSPFVPDEKIAREVRRRSEEQLRLADYIHAACCVNVSGAFGEVWSGCYAENFTRESYQKNVEFVQELCDQVKPTNTYFTLEPMQWMVPDSPEQYLQFIRDVNRDRFAVHMDVINFIKDPDTYTHKKELIERSFALLGPYIKSCHIKDCKLMDGTTVMIREVPIGEGTMDLVTYLTEIAKLDPDMPVLVEHLPELSAYGKGVDYLNAMPESKLDLRPVKEEAGHCGAEAFLIRNTTRAQREQIVRDSLGYGEFGCDDCGDGFDMYWPYIEGKKELKEITMEYQARYVIDMDEKPRRGCPIG